MGKSLRKIRAWRDGLDGVAAIEMSLVALPFFFLLFVILETGYFFLLAILLDGAAAEGAREVRTGIVQQQPTPADALTALQTRVCDRVFLIGCNDLIFDVRNFSSFSGVSVPAPPTTQASATFDPGNPGSTVVVRVIYNWSFITPLLASVVNPQQMVATVAFRNEPYPPP